MNPPGYAPNVVAPQPVIPPTPPRWDIDFEALARDLHPMGNVARLRLLNYLTVPRYMEEIASFLKVNRYAAKKHVDQLLETGLIAKTPAQRPQGVVVEYRVMPEKLFELFDAMRALGTLRPMTTEGVPVAQTKPAEPAKSRGSPGERSSRLIVVYGVELGKAIPLEANRDGAPWIVGRDAGCAIRLLSDPFVSGRHAQLVKGPAGTTVTDLYSTNGTFVDWERLPPGQSRAVENGQVLGFGKSLMLFRDR